MFLALLYCVILLPIRIAFARDEGAFDIFVNCLFAFDMILCFFTAFENEAGDIIVEHGGILKK